MISKKKGLHQNSHSFLPANFGCAPEKKLQFSGANNSKPFTTSAPVGRWAVFIFGAKLGLKSTKNVLSCILFKPMGATAPSAPFGYATELDGLELDGLITLRILDATFGTSPKPNDEADGRP